MSRTSTALAAVALGGALATAAPALGASVSLVGSSPANGAVLGPQDAPFAIPLTWAADITGCGVPTTTGKVVLEGEGRVRAGNPVTLDPSTGQPLGGSSTYTRATSTPITFTWYAEIVCPAAPGGMLRSEIRTFTLQGNPPRLVGAFTVRVHGTPQVWTFRPRCAVGACNTVMTRAGQKGAMLRYDPVKQTYTGTFGTQKIAPERICRTTTKVRGKVVRSRTYKRVYSAVNGRIVLNVRAMGATPDRATAIVYGMVGRQTAQYRYTPRAQALGCPPGRRATAPLIALHR